MAMHPANGPEEPRPRAEAPVHRSRDRDSRAPAGLPSGKPVLLGDLAAGGARLNSTLDATGLYTSRWSGVTTEDRSTYAASSSFRDRSARGTRFRSIFARHYRSI